MKQRKRKHLIIGIHTLGITSLCGYASNDKESFTRFKENVTCKKCTNKFKVGKNN